MLFPGFQGLMSQFPGIVEAVPDLDLHEDVPLGGPLQHVLEALPVVVVPLVHVELAVRQQLVRLELDALALAHRVAHVVGADRVDLVEVLLEVVEQKDVVRLAAAQQHHGLALVLPVGGVLWTIGLDPVGVVGRARVAPHLDRRGALRRVIHVQGRPRRAQPQRHRVRPAGKTLTHDINTYVPSLFCSNRS
jgi:hypothetical protein